MREQIQAYVNGLFADAALTIRNAEVRQEILQHTLDRRSGRLRQAGAGGV